MCRDCQHRDALPPLDAAASYAERLERRVACHMVATEGCRAPANGVASADDHCLRCGRPVCTDPGCSAVVKYLRFGPSRLCGECQHEVARDARRLAAAQP